MEYAPRSASHDRGGRHRVVTTGAGRLRSRPPTDGKGQTGHPEETLGPARRTLRPQRPADKSCDNVARQTPPGRPAREAVRRDDLAEAGGAEPRRDQGERSVSQG